MTGTPTPGGVASEVRHLAPLLQILRHQPYGTNEALWRVRQLCPKPADILPRDTKRRFRKTHPVPAASARCSGSGQPPHCALCGRRIGSVMDS